MYYSKAFDNKALPRGFSLVRHYLVKKLGWVQVRQQTLIIHTKKLALWETNW